MKLHIFNNGLMVESGVSGSDRRALEWTKIFLKKGYKIQLYTPSLGKKRYQNYGSGLKLVITFSYDFLLGIPLLVYLARSLTTIWQVKDVTPGDIFYSTSDLLPDSLPACIGKIRHPKTKWLTGLHLLAPNPFKNTLSARSVYYFFSQNMILFLAKIWADLILVSNNLDRKILVRKGFKPENILVTYGAVDWPVVKKAKSQIKKYEASFIGRFHPQKGLDDLLLIWQLVCRRMKNAKLVMMGELEPLLPKIRKMNLENNIEFLGFVDGVKKFEILKSSKIFLFPSTYESFGMVASEAMACGLPVVAYDLPIYEDIYPGGMIKVPLGDYQKFSQAILALLRDEKKRQELGKKAQEISKKFSWEKTAKQILTELGVKDA